MKKAVFHILAAGAVCFLTTAGLAVAQDASHESHRTLDEPLMEVIDKTLQKKQALEIDKRYPAMMFKPEMMKKNMDEMVLQSSMQSTVQPAIMGIIKNMLVGTLTETLVGDNGQKQKTREEQLDAMEKLSEQVAQVQQDAMNKVYAQAPMQNQMREKMVSTFPYTRYLQDVFMARQKPRTIADFHAGGVVTSRMMERPVPLPVPKLSDSIVNK